MKSSCAVLSLLLIFSSLPCTAQTELTVGSQPAAVPMDAASRLVRAGVAKVVSGDVRVEDPTGAARLLEIGAPLFAGDRLVTEKLGAASMVMRDGTTVVLAGNSELHIQKFAFDTTTQNGSLLINLLYGSMRMVTGLISKVNPDAVQVRTNTMLIGARGTDFIVEAEQASRFGFLGF